VVLIEAGVLMTVLF